MKIIKLTDNSGENILVNLDKIIGAKTFNSNKSGQQHCNSEIYFGAFMMAQLVRETIEDIELILNKMDAYTVQLFGNHKEFKTFEEI